MRMLQLTSRSVYRTVNSWMFKEIPKVHCRRRKRKVWLAVICLCSFIGVILTFGFSAMISTKSSLNIYLVDKLSITDKQSDSMKLMLFDIQAVLRLDNSTKHDPLMVMSSKDHFESIAAPFCWLAKQSEKFISSPKVTLIYSLHNITSSQEALYYLHRSFTSFPADMTDDVIITADISLPETEQEQIEEVVEKCEVCRLFFLKGTIYEQRNFASNFARREFLVFLDGRVMVSKDCLQHMMMDVVKKRVVSPMLQLIRSDGSLHSVGLAVNEIAWDLSVVRGGVDQKVIKKAFQNKVTYISQTVITKEVFLISKEFFNEMGQFDTRPNITGSEHVMFSLKVLSCGGVVVVSLCSTVFLTVSDGAPQPTSPFTDYYNPSFAINHEEYPSRLYTDAISTVFLDNFTLRYYKCVSHVLNLTKYRPEYYTQSPFMRSRTVNLSPARHKTKMEQYLLSHLRAMKCTTKNFRLILFDHQPAMLAPTKFATFYGYIRTTDGLWAIGLLLDNSDVEVNTDYPSSMTTLEGKIVLTRNSSLWIGPFSFTNGAFIFQQKWCLTLLPSNLFSVTKCVSVTTTQLFTYTDYVIRPGSREDKSACSALNSSLSNPLFLSPCNGQNFTNQFKLDVQFMKGCIK